MDSTTSGPNHSARLTAEPPTCGLPWQMMHVDLAGVVTPCVYYRDPGGGGMGNANVASLEEIWNGMKFQELRSRHSAHELEDTPCGTCPYVRLHGRDALIFNFGHGFRREQGLCFVAPIPESFSLRYRERQDDVVVLEDGIPLPLPSSMHDDIRALGAGRYSVWKGYLYLSTLDGSDPSTNGRRYELRVGEDSIVMPKLDRNVESGRNLVLARQEWLEGRTILSAKPTKIGFLERPDCNIDCPACIQNPLRKRRVSHRPETRRDIIDMVPKLLELNWYGGEPYLLPGFRNFVREYNGAEHNPNFELSFMTNGTMITDQEVNHLKRLPGFNITVSIDSFTESTFDRLRPGAGFNRVMNNLSRLLAIQDWPVRRLTVAMIVGKTNICELAQNIACALDLGVRLMVNPIVFYPVSEQVNVFENFELQTIGWDDAISAAEEVTKEARRADRRAIRNIDPTGAVAELRALFEASKAAQRELVELEISLDDSDAGLAQMARPTLIVCKHRSAWNAVAYTEVDRAKGNTFTICIPKSCFDGPLHFGLMPDLFDTDAVIFPADCLIDACSSTHIRRSLLVPPFERTDQRKNVSYVEALKVTDPDQPARARPKAGPPYPKMRPAHWDRPALAPPKGMPFIALLASHIRGHRRQ